MNTQSTSQAISQLIANYSHGGNERGLFFRGMLLKTIDSLDAISALHSTGALWPMHARWLVEAFAIASSLNENERFLDQIKKDGAKTFLIVADIEPQTRSKILNSISQSDKPSVEALLLAFEKDAGAKEQGLLYKLYRLLCEYTHFEYFRTASYPKLGPESADVLETKRRLFEQASIACAASLPCFAHCPPKCGFDDIHYERAVALCKEAWEDFSKADTDLRE